MNFRRRTAGRDPAENAMEIDIFRYHSPSNVSRMLRGGFKKKEIKKKRMQ